MTDTEFVEAALDRWEDQADIGLEAPIEELCRYRPHLAGPVALRILRLRQADWLRPSDHPASRSDLPSRYAAGDTIDARFRLSRLLAQGGHGEVWQGIDLVTRHEYAVKLPRSAPTPAGRQSFEDEARNASRVQHPNIVPVYFAGRDGDAQYLVLRLIKGESLAARLARSQPSVPIARRIAREVAAALVHTHERGLVHRDLKPDNILLDSAGRVYLTDFGIALDDCDARRGAANGTGSPAYMSPEQLRLGSAIDGRCDVYALGVILFEMLTGHLPFGDIVRTKLEGRRPPLATVFNPVVPESLADTIDTCLAPDPSHRFASATELLVELGGDPATSELLPAEEFRAASWDVRLRYLDVLGAVGTVPPGYWEPLVELLRSPLPADRQRVGGFLLKTRESAVPALITALKRTTTDDLDFRDAVLRLLLRIAPMSPTFHAAVVELGLERAVAQLVRSEASERSARGVTARRPTVRAALFAGAGAVVVLAVCLAGVGVEIELAGVSGEPTRPGRVVCALVAGCLALGLAAMRSWRVPLALLLVAFFGALEAGLVTRLEARLSTVTDTISQVLRLRRG